MIWHETICADVYEALPTFTCQNMPQGRSLTCRMMEVTYMNWPCAVARIKKHLKSFTISFVHEDLSFINAARAAMKIFARSECYVSYAHPSNYTPNTARQGLAAEG